MYIATVPNRSSPPAILLRESYREASKVKTRTLANLTQWPAERIEALRRCLKGDFDAIGDTEPPVSDQIFGVLFVLKTLAEQLRIRQALGKDRRAQLALFLVLARVAHQGSRLSAVRWAEEHAVAELLGLEPFDEDDLYAALDWLAERQGTIEQRLYQRYLNDHGQVPALVLYDVTSSYFEGQENERAEYGYNRDGKRGKKQIVIGLLTAPDGEPLAVRVFRGNTNDSTTVAEQIGLLTEQFSIASVVMVGDRGMIKAKGKAALTAQHLKYITALTNPQIRKLLGEQVIQLDLFDETAQEVEHQGRRLVLRCNPSVRQRQAQRREDKLAKLDQLIAQRNAFVAQSRRAQPEAGLRQFNAWIKRYRLSAFVRLSLEQRQLRLHIDTEQQAQAALLDGYYVLETDVPHRQLDAATVDQRYRDLQQVERDFRTMKTTLLEIRPIFVRKACRTHAHVLVAMLALKIVRVMDQRLKAVFGTTAEGDSAVTIADALLALSRLCFQRHTRAGQDLLTLPVPDDKQQRIFQALEINPPRVRQYRPARL